MDKRIPEADEIRYVDLPPALSIDVTTQKVRIHFGANLITVANIAESGRAVGLETGIFLPTYFFLLLSNVLRHTFRFMLYCLFRHRKADDG